MERYQYEIPIRWFCLLQGTNVQCCRDEPIKKTVTLQRVNSTNKIFDVPVSEIKDYDLRVTKKG